VPISKTGPGICIDCCVVLLGAEMVVLGGKGRGVGVNGSSEVDGDGDEFDERSPARAAKAGVPLVEIDQ
jgi:hypothetical protein